MGHDCLPKRYVFEFLVGGHNGADLGVAVFLVDAAAIDESTIVSALAARELVDGCLGTFAFC